MVSTMVFEVPASWLSSKIGERQAMITSAVLGFAMTMLAFFHLGYPALVLSALGFGAAHSLFGLARHSLLAEIVPEQHRPKSMSLLGGMFRGGMAIGPVLGSAFIVLYGVEFGYLAAAILCLASGASVMFAPKGRLKTTPSGQNGNVWKVARREAPKLATLGVASAIISAGRTIRLIGLPLLAIQLGISPGETSFIFGLTGFIDFALFYLSGNHHGSIWQVLVLGSHLVSPWNDLSVLVFGHRRIHLLDLGGRHRTCQCAFGWHKHDSGSGSGSSGLEK